MGKNAKVIQNWSRSFFLILKKENTRGAEFESRNINRPGLYLSSTLPQNGVASTVPNEIAETASSVYTPHTLHDIGTKHWNTNVWRNVAGGNEIVGRNRGEEEWDWNAGSSTFNRSWKARVEEARNERMNERKGWSSRRGSNKWRKRRSHFGRGHFSPFSWNNF